VRTAVIGGGVFGATTAIRLAESGHLVTIYERLPGLFLGTSRYGNRLHLGYHYPRDEETVRQCLRGYERFRREFSEAILGEVANTYFIASEDSLVSADDFIGFCDRLELPYREMERQSYQDRIRNVDIGIVTPEVVFDPVALARVILDRLARLNVSVSPGSEVNSVEKTGSGDYVVTTGRETRTFDAVVNCSYANLSRISAMLGHASPVRQYEYVAVPVIALGESERQTSITILDGPFFCLLPFGSDGDHILNHVDHSVIARQDAPLVDATWLDPGTAPLASRDHDRLFAKILAGCAEFMPELRAARFKRFAGAPRMVLANVEDTDTRPSLISQRSPRYVEVFSGKVDHCTWVGDEVAALLADG
jgi:glycine/D-amino acid oxidase-like deaminating enzyme